MPDRAAGKRWIQGQSMVEIALFLPVLAMILLLALDFGRVYYTYSAITNAARVGAQFGLDPRRSDAEIRGVIRKEVQPQITITDSNITILTPGGRSNNQEFTVEVRYLFKAITPFVSNLLGGGDLTLYAKTTARFSSP